MNIKTIFLEEYVIVDSTKRQIKYFILNTKYL